MNAETLQSLLDDHQPFHSEFQMDHFIVGAGGATDWGRYKQAVRELDKRVRALKSLYIDRELCLIDVEAYERASKSRDPEDLSARRSRLNATKKRFELDSMERLIADTERELRHFYALAAGYRHRLTQEGELTAQRRIDLERREWHTREKREVANVLEGAKVQLPELAANTDVRALLQGGG